MASRAWRILAPDDPVEGLRGDCHVPLTILRTVRASDYNARALSLSQSANRSVRVQPKRSVREQPAYGRARGSFPGCEDTECVFTLVPDHYAVAAACGGDHQFAFG